MNHRGESMRHRMCRRGNEMKMEEMRRLCRTMHTTMRDVMEGEAPSTAEGTTAGNASGDLDLNPQTEQWFGDTRGFEGAEDRTGE